MISLLQRINPPNSYTARRLEADLNQLVDALLDTPKMARQRILDRMETLEAKRDTKERPRQIQRWRLQQWAAAGAVTGVVTSVEDVQRILAEHGLI